MTQSFIPEVWNKRTGRLFRKRSLLIMDTVKCHYHVNVKNSLRRQNTVTLPIDGGMTPILSALATHINKPLKDMMRAKWED